MRLILPKTLVPRENIIGPLFFLLGPIRGGDDWQRIACELLSSEVPDCVIVVPCRWGPAHPLGKFGLSGLHDSFSRQVHWERYYLEEAALKAAQGSIIAWLPAESKTNPRADGQPYARDTMGELGEWRGRMMHDNSIRFVMGAEEGFPGLDVMKANFEHALSRHETRFDIYPSLEMTVLAAAKGYKSVHHT